MMNWITKQYNFLIAHKSPVLSIKFNRSSKLIWTASWKGTVIRIFNIPYL